jgi:hypothetical protein
VCSLSVAFAPTRSGLLSATLQIVDDSAQHVHLVTLAGSAP